MNTKNQSLLPWNNIFPSGEQEYRPDDRAGNVYLQDERLKFVTELALITRRPLLLRGEPGSGKSSYAPFLARNLNWRYYEHAVSTRTEAKDLLWEFDGLRRLQDAHFPPAQRRIGVKHRSGLAAINYVRPGPIWWAFDRSLALEVLERQSMNTGGFASSEPFGLMNQLRDPHGAVVLIDEIDKADPNVPNDLLDVLGHHKFRIDEVGIEVSRKDTDTDVGNLLIVITTNEERDLPPAVMRRCVVHNIKEPDAEGAKISRLVEIANLHMGPLAAKYADGEQMIRAVAMSCVRLRSAAIFAKRRGTSVAEFLDAVRFCLVRSISPHDERWKMVEQSVLYKDGNEL